jgi:outer membrane lipoprotein SlyB
MVMKFKNVVVALVVAACLGGCANRSVRDVSVGDSGQSYKVKFGTVIAQTSVNVRSSGEAAAGGGALAGGLAGAAIGRSDGAALAGLVIGGIAAAAAHHAAETGNAIQYTIAFADGSTQVINQIQTAEDPVFKPGHPVMVQFGANRNLVLDASHLPNSVRRPKQVVVEGGRSQNGPIGVTSCQSANIGGTRKASCTEQ